MDSVSINFSDRINWMNMIFSRFPEETVKTATAFRRNFGRYVNEIMGTLFIN